MTVIVPMHNRADSIAAALRSIAQQTRRPARVIVVDDASTDDSIAVARTSNLANLELIELKSNHGAGAARNVGAMLATTNWLAFLDADDTWEPTFLELVVGGAVHLDADFASSGGIREMVRVPTIVRVLKGSPDARDATADFWRIARHWMPIVPSSAVIARHAFVRAGGFDDDVRWGEDVPFFARLWLNGRFVFVNEPLYRSAQRPDGLSALRRSYRDTALHLLRIGDTLVRAAIKRQPGTRVFVGTYVRRVYRRHRNYASGVLRSWYRSKKSHRLG